MNNRKKKYFWHPMTDTRASEEETIVLVLTCKQESR